MRPPAASRWGALRAVVLSAVCLLAADAAAQKPPPKTVPKPAAAPAPPPAPPRAAEADPDDGEGDGSSTVRTAPPPAAASRTVPTPGAQRVIKIDRAQLQGKGELEIFPNAKEAWMHVYGTDAAPIEAARADRPGSWICRGGARCDVTPPLPDVEGVGDRILVSIGLSASTSPLPVPIWTRDSGDGVLLFNPILMGRANYDSVRAFPPIAEPAPAAPAKALAPKAQPQPPAAPPAAAQAASAQPPQAQPPRPAPPVPAAPPAASARPPAAPASSAARPAGSAAPATAAKPPHMPPSIREASDQTTLALSMRWPRETDAAEFRYIAVQDSCGNARVQPFQRTFSVPVVEVAEDSCPPADGKVLRVFPRGGSFKVTAFNLKPERSDIVSVTYRVSIPALDSGLDPAGAYLLFPDFGKEDLRIDCGIGQDTPPTPPPSDKPPSGKAAAPPVAGSGRKGHAIANQTFVVAPEPLMMGNCRLMLTGPAKGRLQAPMALYVVIERMDKGTTEPLMQKEWVVTQRSSIMNLPPLRGDNFDPESRLRIRISSDPFSTNGKVMLLADAARVWPAVRLRPSSNTGEFRREIAESTIISAPLCGGWNIETSEKVGNCLRAYVTMPVLLASFQVTRSPWKETPIAEPRLPAGIGLALAIDSYNPVKQRPFPLAVQLGGLYQSLSDSKTGIMAYLGIAPSFPVLGKGGSTTSIGILLAGGTTYVMDKHGPNEGFKPAAFISLVLGAGELTFKGAPSADLSAAGSISAGTN
jgi:hypothetical protein